MANNVKWGALPLNHVRDLTSKWDGEKSTNNLLHGCMVLRPANGGKSKAGKPQYEGGNIKLDAPVFLFQNNKVILHANQNTLNTLFNYEGTTQDADAKTWVSNGCIIVIPCDGNAHLELLHSIYEGLPLTGDLCFDPNGKAPTLTDDDKALAKQLVSIPQEEWTSEMKSLVDAHSLPCELFDFSQRAMYKKVFKYEFKTQEELVELIKKFDIGGTAKSGNGSSGGYSKGGGSIVNVYQNETSLDKFKSLLTILGLPETSTAKDVVLSIQSGKVADIEYRLASSLIGFSCFIPSNSSQTVTLDVVDSPIPVLPTYTDTLKTRVSTLITDKLGSLRGKLPANWEMPDDVAEDWLNAIEIILSSLDMSDITNSKKVSLIAGEDKQPSLVLYKLETLNAIIKELELPTF